MKTIQQQKRLHPLIDTPLGSIRDNKYTLLEQQQNSSAPPCVRGIGNREHEQWKQAGGANHTLLVIHLANQNMLSGNQPSKVPSRTVTQFLPSLVFSPAHYSPVTYASASRTFPLLWRNSTIQCCFPCGTCDNRVEKYSDRSTPDSLHSPVVHVCARFIFRKSCRGRWKRGNNGSEHIRAGQNLGHSQDL